MTQKHEIPKPKEHKHATPHQNAPKPIVPPRPPVRAHPAPPGSAQRGR
jgi:hypothetical protein